MKYVIDSSVALRWVIPEIDSVKALRLLTEFMGTIHELLARFHAVAFECCCPATCKSRPLPTHARR